MRKTTFLILLVLGIILNSYGQSTTGTRGLVKIPTARMFEDGTLTMGAAFIPPGYFRSTSGYYARQIGPNAGLNTFITINLFPFMELMFRYTHEMNIKVTPQNQYFPDRMFSARFRLLEESKNIPGLVLGLQDMVAFFDTDAASGGDAPNFSSTYLTATKKFNYLGFEFDGTIGYGFKLGEIPVREFKGFFGGVEITVPYLEKTQLLLDYDAKDINIGIQKLFFKRIHSMVSYYPKYQKIGWVIAYRYKIY